MNESRKEGMTMELRNGQVVRLRSGGPAMTVKSNASPIYWCQWFVGTILEEAEFRKESLVVVEAEQTAAQSSAPAHTDLPA